MFTLLRKFVPVPAMKAAVGVKVYSNSFLTPVLDRAVRASSRSSHISLRKDQSLPIKCKTGRI